MSTNIKKKVLLVEDDETIIQMYTMKLKESFEVATASTGVAALEMVEEVKPDIILLDIIIPQKDGFTVLKELKSKSTTKGIAVILLTNLGQDSDREKGEQAGAIDYVVKSDYTPQQVLDKINDYFSKNK